MKKFVREQGDKNTGEKEITIENTPLIVFGNQNRLERKKKKNSLVCFCLHNTQ
jgi:hypothetical protein